MNEFPALIVADGGVIDIDSSYGEFEDSFTINFMNRLGSAAFLADCASDIPVVSTFTERRSGQFETIATSFGYCKRDVRRAIAYGHDLKKDDAQAAMETLMEYVDRVWVNGSPSNGIYGLLNQPFATTLTLPADGNQNGGINSIKLIHKTGDQVLRDLHFIANYPISLTNGIRYFNVMYVSQTQYEYISRLVAPGITTGKTVLEFFLDVQARNPRGVRAVLPLPYLKDQGTGGLSDRILAFNDAPTHIQAKAAGGLVTENSEDKMDMCTVLMRRIGSVVLKRSTALVYVNS
ncbi:MAG: major capsid family protein [Xenococcaceae cyanobacterium]